MLILWNFTQSAYHVASSFFIKIWSYFFRGIALTGRVNQAGPVCHREPSETSLTVMECSFVSRSATFISPSTWYKGSTYPNRASKTHLSRCKGGLCFYLDRVRGILTKYSQIIPSPVSYLILPKIIHRQPPKYQSPPLRCFNFLPRPPLKTQNSLLLVSALGLG